MSMRRRNPKQGLLTRNCGEEGALGEVLVTADLMLHGYQVFRAVSPSCDFDLVALKDGLLLKVEVTKGTHKRGSPKLYWSPHTNAYDLLAVWEANKAITYFPALV